MKTGRSRSGSLESDDDSLFNVKTDRHELQEFTPELSSERTLQHIEAFKAITDLGHDLEKYKKKFKATDKLNELETFEHYVNKIAKLCKTIMHESKSDRDLTGRILELQHLHLQLENAYVKKFTRSELATWLKQQVVTKEDLVTPRVNLILALESYINIRLNESSLKPNKKNKISAATKALHVLQAQVGEQRTLSLTPAENKALNSDILGDIMKTFALVAPVDKRYQIASIKPLSQFSLLRAKAIREKYEIPGRSALNPDKMFESAKDKPAAEEETKVNSKRRSSKS